MDALQQAVSGLIDDLTVAYEAATDPEEREELRFLLNIWQEQVPGMDGDDA